MPNRKILDRLGSLFPIDLANQFVAKALKEEYDEGKNKVLIAPECKDPEVARQVARMFGVSRDTQKKLVQLLIKWAGKTAGECAGEPEHNEIAHHVIEAKDMLITWWIESLALACDATAKDQPVRLDSELVPVEFPDEFRQFGKTSWYDLLREQFAASPLTDEQVRALLKAFAENVKAKLDKHPEGMNVVGAFTICKDDQGYYLPPLPAKSK